MSHVLELVDQTRGDELGLVEAGRPVVVGDLSDQVDGVKP
jgi:hypothetical protein